jgi:hypothetical protein
MICHGYFWNACASPKRKEGPDTSDKDTKKFRLAWPVMEAGKLVAGPSHQEWVINDLSRIFVTQPARKPRRHVDLSSPSNQEGRAYVSIGANGYECRLGDDCTHRTTGPFAKKNMKEHLAHWIHNKEFAYFPHDLVFKTDMEISGDAPTAWCVFGL